MIMEILNNFASIYCFIAFVIGAVFMLAMLSIAAMGKVKEPRNKVRFFVMIDPIQHLPYLYIKDIEGLYHCICSSGRNFDTFGLNPDDFIDMKKGEIREVFINLED